MTHLEATRPTPGRTAEGNLQTSTGRPALPALTSIRFFAALHVALYHLVRPFSLWGPLSGFMASGYSAVSFFFLLSGFILTYSHADPHLSGQAHFRYKRFLFARWARLYPLYLLTTLAAGILDYRMFARHIHILAFVADLLMVQTWSVRMVSFFNVPAWSLSAEVFFYAVFPLAFFRLRPSTPTRAWLQMLGWWALAMVMPLVAMAWTPAAAWHEGVAGVFVFWIHRFPLFALPEFLAGIPLGWLLLRYPPSLRACRCSLAAGITGAATLLLLGNHLPFAMLYAGLLIPCYALILLGLAQPSQANGGNPSLATHLLSARWLVLLGESSYALYLTSFLFNDWAKDHLGVGEGLWAAAGKLAVLLPLSIALHLWIERPARRWLLNRGSALPWFT